MSGAITEKQLTALRVIHTDGTIRSICAALGGVSTNAAYDHIRALRRKGAIEAAKPVGCSARWQLTPFGLLMLGLALCPTCHGDGTVAA